MNFRLHIPLCVFVLALPLCAWQSEAGAAKRQPVSSHAAATPSRVVVPEKVAAVLFPVLDQLHQQHEDDFANSFYKLQQRKGPSVDEALVVLMCFDVDESQEETDAVIKRGRRMLPYINKYRHRNPSIPDREYPDTMLKTPASKDETFRGAIKAIRHGWHSTAENPEG
jgi:hypothetical protein